ncbi:hypothetical protein [Paenibacillus mucilaginosus]|nr:hypothetical protein [Paenibacillus mucilaginosus]
MNIRELYAYLGTLRVPMEEVAATRRELHFRQDISPKNKELEVDSSLLEKGDMVIQFAGRCTGSYLSREMTVMGHLLKQVNGPFRVKIRIEQI